MKFISEVFEDVRAVKAEEEKIYRLRVNKSDALLKVLSYAYNRRYVFFTDVIPKYLADDGQLGLNPSNIFININSFNVLLKNHPTDEYRKSRILLQFLEGMHSAESDIFCGIIGKDLSHLGISYDLVNKTFPGLLHNDENKVFDIVVKKKPVAEEKPIVTSPTLPPQSISENKAERIEATLVKKNDTVSHAQPFVVISKKKV